ncbi:MAG: hypothetical protein FJX57_19420 [Alphaproteobacteria bacterium]|nr:hypothetical protein [Alphaproteobacteria bacterium]
MTALRLEGTPGSVAARTEGLRKLIAGRARDEELHSMRSTKLWREIRDLASLLPDPQACLWRLSLPPADAAGAVAGLGGTRFFDWGGGLVWLATPATGDGGEATIRRAIARSGGHATLMRGPEALRAAIPVFQPQTAALATITRRVKEGFDPKRILNPGRMYAGI